MSVSHRPALSGRFSLRAATAEVHARLDAMYGAFDLTTTEGYAGFLSAHAAAFIPVEDALAAAGAERLVPGWTARRRADALRSDLRGLGLGVPPAQPSPPFADEASLLGGLYVLEGSRLGGAVLIKAVPPPLPKSFLTPGNPMAWRAFTTLMDERLGSRGDLDAAQTSALAVFGVFERAAQASLGAHRS